MLVSTEVENVKPATKAIIIEANIPSIVIYSDLAFFNSPFISLFALVNSFFIFFLVSKI